MFKTRSRARFRAKTAVALAASSAAALLFAAPNHALAQRVTGIDVSEWQGDLQQTTWNNVKAEGRSFAFIRSSRGGSTGYYNQSDAWNELRRNTLSQRFDDRYFETNAARAVTAGLYIGPYHFSRQDVYTNSTGTTKYGDGAQAQGTPTLSTAWFNYGDVANTGADEARHFLQQAGPWMKPGYLLPVYDFEAGERQLNATQQSVFSVAFANTILASRGIQTICYVNQNYAINEADATLPAAMPINWVARWPNQADPDVIDIHNIDPPPSPSTANVYGQWYPAGQPYPTPQPWKFWQYGSSNTNVGGITPVDVDVAHGDIEYLKEMLVPALWTKTTT
ncbi:MAG: hypothetical protein QOF78_993, partial [Phycisphaerales bacterium]|nr:hypothetical protein [Phycisphaerales bacterium]